MWTLFMHVFGTLITCSLSTGYPGDTHTQHTYRIVKANADLPSCINVTEGRLQENDSNLPVTTPTRDSVEKGANTGHFWTEVPDRFTTCFPLSPQLRHCDIATIAVGNYTIYNQTLVYGVDKNFTVQLGDFFIHQNCTAIVCSQWINVTRTKSFPRCHYLNLQAEQYEINNDGSFYFKAARVMLERPNYTEDSQEKTANICYPLSIDFLNCPVKVLFRPSQFIIQKDKKLQLRSSEETFNLSEHYFHTADTDVVACFVDDNRYDTSRCIAKVYAGFFVFSTICLLLTLVVKIRSSKSNCCDKCLICHISCLLIFTVLATVNKFTQVWPNACYTFFVLAYLTVMASNFWLNIIAFDIWQCFARHPGESTCISRLDEQCRFRCYLMYAFGIPIAAVAFISILDHNRSLQDKLTIYPDIKAQCWLNDRNSQLAFYNGPLIVIMGINIVFFILTVINIRKAGKGTAIVNVKRDKQRLIICIKLFVIMGICWMIDGILASVQDYLPFFYWYISETINALQGFAIFMVLVVCSTEALKTIRDHISASKAFFYKRRCFCKNSKVDCKIADVQRQGSNTILTTHLSLEVQKGL